MFIYIYTHAYIHTYIHTYIHAYMHTCIHAYMHTCIHAYMHTCIHTYIHTYICTYTHILYTYMCIYIYVCTPSGVDRLAVGSHTPLPLLLGEGARRASGCREPRIRKVRISEFKSRGKLPVDLGIPPLRIKNMLESHPLKSSSRCVDRPHECATPARFALSQHTVEMKCDRFGAGPPAEAQ